MKKIIALLLATLTLLAGCGSAVNVDTTLGEEVTVAPTHPEVTEPEVTEPEVTEPAETAPPVKVEREDFKINVKDDTYVVNKDGNGDQYDKSFSTDAIIDVKTSGPSLTRYGYVKFDISELEIGRAHV